MGIHLIRLSYLILQDAAVFVGRPAGIRPMHTTNRAIIGTADMDDRSHVKILSSWASKRLFSACSRLSVETKGCGGHGDTGDGSLSGPDYSYTNKQANDP